jgi:hypothetical protein
MNAWEGQVIAIAVKELLEAVKSLGRDGFGRRDKTILSRVIRDLLSPTPDIARAEAALKTVESLGPSPPPDYYVAKRMLDAVRRSRRETRGYGRPAPPPPSAAAPAESARVPPSGRAPSVSLLTPDDRASRRGPPLSTSRPPRDNS